MLIISKHVIHNHINKLESTNGEKSVNPPQAGIFPSDFLQSHHNPNHSQAKTYRVH